jgi:hypothetical protein
MGIALLALSGLFNKLSSPPRATTVQPQRRPARLHPVWAQRTPACPPASVHQARAGDSVRTPAALRIMHVREQDCASLCAGRMVISGRMADVCAELDRLVALEARQRSA